MHRSYTGEMDRIGEIKLVALGVESTMSNFHLNEIGFSISTMDLGATWKKNTFRHIHIYFVA